VGTSCSIHQATFDPEFCGVYARLLPLFVLAITL